MKRSFHRNRSQSARIRRLIARLALLCLTGLPAIYLAAAEATGPAGGNPVLPWGGSADPAVLVVGDTMWLYPTRDHQPGMKNFRMENYRAYSSKDLMNWTDHGVILDGATDLTWCHNPHNHHAATMIEYGGKFWFYFFFPNNAPEKGGVRGTEVGVVVGDTPLGPFKDPLNRPLIEPTYVPDMHNATPTPLVDRDGKLYLFWGNSGKTMVEPMAGPADLGAPDFRELDPPPPAYSEGVWVFRRENRYYFTYSAGSGFNPQGVYYGISDKPMGPYTWNDVLMNVHNRQTHHHAMAEFHGQWYMFYHWDNVEGLDRKFRQTAIEHMFFNDDGTIALCIPTLAGVGPFPADRWIEAVKFAQGTGTRILDGGGEPCNWDDTWNDVPFVHGRRGDPVENARTSTRKDLVKSRRWKVLEVDAKAKPANITYRGMIFGASGPDGMELRVAGGSAKVLVRIGDVQGPVVGEGSVSGGGETKWDTVRIPVKTAHSGVKPLHLEISDGRVLIDRIRFTGTGPVTFPLPRQRSISGVGRLEPENADETSGISVVDVHLVINAQPTATMTFRDLSFSQPANTMRIRHQGEASDTAIELRRDGADGPLLASASLPASPALIVSRFPVKGHTAGDGQTLCLVVKTGAGSGGKRARQTIDWIALDCEPLSPRVEQLQRLSATTVVP